MALYLKRPEEFRKVYQRGQLKFGRFAAVHVLAVPEDTEFRIGLSVSKKVGNAVVRNRVKRRLREIIRSIEGELVPGFHVVIGTKVRAKDAPYWELHRDICRTMKGLGLLGKK